MWFSFGFSDFLPLPTACLGVKMCVNVCVHGVLCWTGVPLSPVLDWCPLLTSHPVFQGQVLVPIQPC